MFSIHYKILFFNLKYSLNLIFKCKNNFDLLNKIYSTIISYPNLKYLKIINFKKFINDIKKHKKINHI